MLEALINEDQETAKEIFHNIVVGKSREIYQELLAEDFTQDTGNPYGKKEEEEGEEGEEEEEEEGNDDFSDEEGDEEEGDEEEGDEEGLEDRVMDLEDALEDLKAEFEQLLSQEEEEGNHDINAIHAAGDEEGGEHEIGGEHDDLDSLMEYVNKVGGNTYNTFGKMGDNGNNTKSAVAGKNDMGGTAANIAQSFSTEKGGTEGGLAKTKAGDLTSGLGTIQNRVDSKAGKTAFTKKEAGGGVDAQKSFQKDAADNKKSVIGKRVR